MTSEPARFAPFGRSMSAWVMSFLFFALTGPVLVVEHTIRARIERRIAGIWAGAGMAVAAIWRCCSGVLVLDLVLTVRDSLP
jgi:hypothetical protein